MGLAVLANAAVMSRVEFNLKPAESNNHFRNGCAGGDIPTELHTFCFKPQVWFACVFA